MTETDPGPATLEALEARLARDFEFLVLPPTKDWLEPREHPQYGPALDVAVIGAGMSGLSAAFALKCLAIRSPKVFDRSPAGFEGPWATFARMETLRSPPELSGPSFGFSNVSRNTVVGLVMSACACGAQAKARPAIAKMAAVEAARKVFRRIGIAVLISCSEFPHDSGKRPS